MELVKMTVNDYLQLVASDAPAPGGGSASALCGAQGAGLLSMAAKLTLQKARLSEYHPACARVSENCDEIVKKLTVQIDADTQSYAAMAAAFKLPRDSEELKKARRAAIAEATLFATQVPLETMRLCLEGLEQANALADNYNTNCASDVGSGISGLYAGLKGARMNVLINFGGIADKELALKLKNEADEIFARAEELSAALEAKIMTQLQ